jgi:Spy/CpxP family protein refolding chaperone
MKKVILFTLLIVGVNFVGLAQEAKSVRTLHEKRGQRQGGGFTAEERAKVFAKRMQKSLGLTDEQYKKVLAINIEQAKKQGELRAAHKAEMQAQHQDLSKKYESVLTPEQLKKFKEEQKKRKAEMQEQRGEEKKDRK